MVGHRQADKGRAILARFEPEYEYPVTETSLRTILITGIPKVCAGVSQNDCKAWASN